MTVTEKPFTDEERRAGLRWLVTASTTEAVQELLLTGWAHPSLRCCAREEAWLEFSARWKAYLDLQDGLITWRDVDPGLLGDNRTQVALEIALQDADEALDVLIGGAS